MNNAYFNNEIFLLSVCLQKNRILWTLKTRDMIGRGRSI